MFSITFLDSFPRMRGWDETVDGSAYPVQNDINIAPCIDDRCLATQLRDLAQHAHDAVLEVCEVRGKDAGCLWVVHCE